MCERKHDFYYQSYRDPKFIFSNNIISFIACTSVLCVNSLSIVQTFGCLMRGPSLTVDAVL